MTKKYYWLNKDSRKFLAKDYLPKGVKPEDRIWQIAKRAEEILKKEGFAAKFEDYMSRGFYSLSTPVWMNFGNSRGLPISCNGSYISDTMRDILFKTAEVGMMTKYGSGTSAYFGRLRECGARLGTELENRGTSSGPVHFIQLFDSVADVVSQGSARRGQFAAYLPVDHPDILDFLDIKDHEHHIQNVNIGVTISDKWMEEAKAGDKKKVNIWKTIIQKRCEKGYPYILFFDTVNNNKPQVYKDKEMMIWASNLCSEICLPSSPDESFVCNLSSMNLFQWEEWRHTDAVETLLYFLDAVMTEYIDKTATIEFMEAPHKFAKNHRALGLGVLGWHSLLQSRMLPFDSMEAKLLNTQIFSFIRKHCDEANKAMAIEYGEPELLKGYGLRNTTVMAIAPTTSSSFILGQISPGIEPITNNYFVKKTQKGSFTEINPLFIDLIKSKVGEDEEFEDVLESVLLHGGSCQHLDILSDLEKEVYKTFGEISQKEIIIQAAARQQYIDQGQSLNLMIAPDVEATEIGKLLAFAWEQKVKCLYYQHSANPAQQLARSLLACKSCEG